MFVILFKFQKIAKTICHQIVQNQQYQSYIHIYKVLKKMITPERKIINIFKSFIERIFVPQLPKMDTSCQQEWNKFSALITAQSININQLQIYVDTLPGVNSSLYLNRQSDRPQNKSPLFPKTRKDTADQINTGFNPMKTFGGQRARGMFPLKDFDDSPGQKTNYNFSKDFSKNKQEQNPGISTQMILPSLQRLFKVFSDNQTKMQKAGTSQISMPSYQTKTYYNPNQNQF